MFRLEKMSIVTQKSSIPPLIQVTTDVYSTLEVNILSITEVYMIAILLRG